MKIQHLKDCIFKYHILTVYALFLYTTPTTAKLRCDSLITLTKQSTLFAAFNWYPWSDSNWHFTGSKPADSTNWPTRALGWKGESNPRWLFHRQSCCHYTTNTIEICDLGSGSYRFRCYLTPVVPSLGSFLLARIFWCWWPGSNRWPLLYQSSALPTVPHEHWWKAEESNPNPFGSFCVRSSPRPSLDNLPL